MEKENENKEKILSFDKLNSDRIFKQEENEKTNIRAVTSELKNYAEAFKPVGFYMDDGNSNGIQSLNSNEFFKIFQIQDKPDGNTSKINLNSCNASTIGIKQRSAAKEESNVAFLLEKSFFFFSDFSNFSTGKILRAFPLNKSALLLKSKKVEENAKISCLPNPSITFSSKKKFTVKDLED